jgi:hypothetical protein
MIGRRAGEREPGGAGGAGLIQVDRALGIEGAEREGEIHHVADVAAFGERAGKPDLITAR